MGMLLVACDALEQVEPSEPRFCTLAGCESGFTVYTGHDFVDGIEYRVEACIDGRCEDWPIAVPTPDDGPFTGSGRGRVELSVEPDSVHYSIGDGDWSGTHRIAVTVHDAVTGELLVAVDEEVIFQHQQPNGPDCPPVCWFAEVLA